MSAFLQRALGAGIVAGALLGAVPALGQDAAPSDGETVEAGTVDAETVDAETVDAETVEAGTEEATVEQASAEDATEAATVEEASEEAAVEQASVEDATEAATVEAATVEEASAEASGDPEPETSHSAGPALTFANSFFSYTNAVTVHTFAPAAQLSYDPTWLMQMNLTPRFYLTDTTFLWLNQSVSLEVTDSNFDTYNREPLLADTLLDLRQLLSWEGFVFQGQLRVGFPLSKASQAAGRILQTGVGLTVARPFPELAGFTVAATFGYRRWWATRNVPFTHEPDGGSCFTPSPGETPECQQASGLSTARDILLGGLTLNLAPIPGLTISASGFYFTTYGHELADAVVPINGGDTTHEDGSVTHWRPFTYFALAVAYDVLPWLNLQLGIQNSGGAAPLYNPDGSVRSPFSPDTQVFLTSTVSLDGLYGEIVGGDSEDDLTPEERQRRRQGLARSGGSSAF